MGGITPALNRFYHALHISQMRRNIKKCGTDLCSYTDDYPKTISMGSWTKKTRFRT